jgi:cysteine desulfurase/selenocysteine lyase
MTADVQRALTLDEIREELLDCDSADERLNYLIEIGDTLSPFPHELCIEAYRVLGCQSMVWLVPTSSDDRVTFIATSDAPMVRGLIAILVAAYSGQKASDILKFPIESFFDQIKLKSFITPMRSNGLHSMILRVISLAKESMATTLPATSSSQTPSQPAPTLPTRSISSVLDDFPILSRRHSGGERLVYLDSAASSQRPRQVIQAMSQVYGEHYSNVHRSGHELAATTTTAMEASRNTIARFINAPESESVIFTSGTTNSINAVARAWGDANVTAGDEILLTVMEHHSNIVPWQQLAQRTGAVIKWLPIKEDFQLDVECLSSLLSKRTKIVAVTAVSNVLGTINPLRHIIDLAHQAGSAVLVDAAQSIPHGSCNVQDLDADFVVFSGHKMLGPTGVGILYGKKQILNAMPPFLGGGNMIKSVTLDGFEPADLPYRLEAGTPPIVEAIAMKSAVEYLEAIGPENILNHERMLVGLVHDRLSKFDRLKIYGPAVDKKSGIVTFSIDGLHPDEIGRRLDAQGIAIRVGHHCAMPLHHRLGLSASCRASFYLYNTPDDASRFCDALENLLKSVA